MLLLLQRLLFSVSRIPLCCQGRLASRPRHDGASGRSDARSKKTLFLVRTRLVSFIQVSVYIFNRASPPLQPLTPRASSTRDGRRR